MNRLRDVWYSPQQYNSQSVKQLRMYVKNNHLRKDSLL